MVISIVIALLLMSLVFAHSSLDSCKLPAQHVKAFLREGDIVLGGIIVVHWKHSDPDVSFKDAPQAISCTDFQVRSYREVIVVAFAVHEINRDPKILPNVTLGFRIQDSCLSEVLAVANTFSLLSGREVLVPNFHCNANALLPGVVGESFEAITIPMATILGVYKVPQISYGSTGPILSNKQLFPSFFRTVPSDVLEASAIGSFLKYFGWTWVGILASDNEYGVVGSELLKEKIIKTDGCVAFIERVSDHPSKERVHRIAELIGKSAANVIVVYSHVGVMVPIFEMVSQLKIRGKVWLGATSFIITPDLFTKETWESLNGTIAFALHVADIPGFKEFVHHLNPATSPDDTFIRLFWEKAFNCKWQGINMSQVQGDGKNNNASLCTGKEDVANLNPVLFDLENLRYTYNAYLAVHSFAHALHDLIINNSWDGNFTNLSSHDFNTIQPQKVLHYLRKVHFVTDSGEEIFFNQNGDPPAAVYDILNWQMFPDGVDKFLTVGSFDYRREPGQEISINSEALLWNSVDSGIPQSVCSASCTSGFRKAALQGQPTCCFDCVPCADGEITNETDAAVCIKCQEDQWSNERRDSCVPRSIEFLSYGEPLGATLASISTVLSLLNIVILGIFCKYRDTAIIKANNRDLSYLLLVSLMLCFLCSYMFIGQPMKWTCMFRKMAFGLLFSFSVSCILAKTIIVIVAFNATNPTSQWRNWTGPRAPFYIVFCCFTVQLIICAIWVLTKTPHYGINTVTPKKLIIQCFDGSVALFCCMLGYMGLLACVSFIVAFFARKLPDSFNEAKYITFSLLVFVSVWLSFIPAYLSTDGKYMVAVEVFAILASNSGLMACIFFPKVNIILLRPECNTKSYLLNKKHIKDKIK